MADDFSPELVDMSFEDFQPNMRAMREPGEADQSVRNKIVSLREMAFEIGRLKSEGKKVVHCHGCFDLLHIGHLRHLQQARSLGGALVVTITPDRFVDKGPGRPAFTQDLRAEALASLASVDYVAVNDWPTAEETLRLLRPDVYAKGAEFKHLQDPAGKIGGEARIASDLGIELLFTEDIVFSSSNLINRYFSNLSQEANIYLEDFRKRYSLEQVLEVLEKMEQLRVLVVGDCILDDYQYCKVIGRSSKDPILAVHHQDNDLQVGGALAVANHTANFVSQVDAVSLIGGADDYESFIRSRLKSNVNPHFMVKPNAPTLIKRRFIDSYSLNKLLEVYIMDSSGPLPEQDQEACGWLARNLENYDLVIASDFGHGAVTKGMQDAMCDHAPFLAVNTQANAGNRGFHTLSRYKRGDYFCLAEHEIRLEMRDHSGPMRPMLNRLGDSLNCRRLVATLGSKGCLIRNKKGLFEEVPAFSHKVVDRVGSGDAFLALTSLACRLGVSDKMLGFLGNVMGSLAVEIVGNARSVERASVEKYITALMK